MHLCERYISISASDDSDECTDNTVAKEICKEKEKLKTLCASELKSEFLIPHF